MTRRTAGSVFVAGDCATANSYCYNPHGEATLLRPTSTANAFREHATFPLDDDEYAGAGAGADAGAGAGAGVRP